MRALFVILSALFLFFGLFGTLTTSKVFASKESNSLNITSEPVQISKSLSIKDLDQYTARENLRFTIRNAGGILIPSSVD